MSNAPSQQEPSMEEILASIRRIISEEAQAPAAQAEEVMELTNDMRVDDTPVAPAKPLETIDDLMESFQPAARPSDSAPPPAPAPEVLEVIPATMPEMAVPEPYSPPPPPPVEEARPVMAPPPPLREDPILSPHTEAAAAAALAGLSALGGNTRFEGGTVEGVVRDLLRPMLREWLDANLPGLIERLVEAEIERLSRRR